MWETNNIKPQIVQKAVRILYGTLILGIIRSIMEFPRLAEQSAAVGGMGFVIFVQAFTFGLLCLLIYLIGKRKNWARYIFVVLTVLGIPFSVKPLIDSLTNEPISGVLELIQIAAQIVALILLFKSPAKEWFSKRAE